ncbi:MAG: hypothetical protein ACQEQF_10130 [Bacillota bacterium]
MQLLKEIKNKIPSFVYIFWVSVLYSLILSKQINHSALKVKTYSFHHFLDFDFLYLDEFIFKSTLELNLFNYKIYNLIVKVLNYLQLAFIVMIIVSFLYLALKRKLNARIIKFSLKIFIILFLVWPILLLNAVFAVEQTLFLPLVMLIIVNGVYVIIFDVDSVI